MNRIATVFAVFAMCSVVLTAQETEKVKFTATVPVKGTVFTAARTMTGDLNVDVKSGGQSVMQMKSKKDESKIIELTVLEAGEKGITKMRHCLKKFEDSDTTEMMGQLQDESETDVRTGNSYVVALKEGKLEVTDLEGAAVDAGVVAAYEKDLKADIALGRLHAPHSGMDKFLGGKVLAVGDVLELDKETLHELMKGPKDNEDMNLTVEKATMTLLKKATYLGRDCGVFKVEAKMVGAGGAEQGGMTITMDLSGEVSIGTADCFTYKVVMSGPVTMDGKQAGGPHGDMIMSGVGTMKVKEDVLVTQKKAE